MAFKPKTIDFTAVANFQLDTTIQYLINEFGKKTAEKFVIALYKKLNTIADGLVAHRFFYKSKNIRYFILQKRNYVLYKELKSAIRVVGIYSMKQDISAIKKIK